MLRYEATEMGNETLTLERRPVGDSYRQEIRKTKNHTREVASRVDPARAKAIQRAALRKKYRAKSREGRLKMDTSTTAARQLGMF